MFVFIERRHQNVVDPIAVSKRQKVVGIENRLFFRPFRFFEIDILFVLGFPAAELLVLGFAVLGAEITEFLEIFGNGCIGKPRFFSSGEGIFVSAKIEYQVLNLPYPLQTVLFFTAAAFDGAFFQTVKRRRTVETGLLSRFWFHFYPRNTFFKVDYSKRIYNYF